MTEPYFWNMLHHWYVRLGEFEEVAEEALFGGVIVIFLQTPLTF